MMGQDPAGHLCVVGLSVSVESAVQTSEVSAVLTSEEVSLASLSLGPDLLQK